MAKKSMVEREKKRARLRQKYEAKRAELKEQFRTAEDFEEKLAIHQKLQELPRNSAPSRHRNRCLTTGRPRGYYLYPVWSSLAGSQKQYLGKIP